MSKTYYVFIRSNQVQVKEGKEQQTSIPKQGTPTDQTTKEIKEQLPETEPADDTLTDKTNTKKKKGTQDDN